MSRSLRLPFIRLHSSSSFATCYDAVTRASSKQFLVASRTLSTTSVEYGETCLNRSYLYGEYAEYPFVVASLSSLY